MIFCWGAPSMRSIARPRTIEIFSPNKKKHSSIKRSKTVKGIHSTRSDVLVLLCFQVPVLISQLFEETYCELRPRSAVPELNVEFFSFANINNTIRLREGKLLVRISDLLEGAPDYVLRAIASRKNVSQAHQSRTRDALPPLRVDSAHVTKGAPSAPDTRTEADRFRARAHLQPGGHFR